MPNFVPPLEPGEDRDRRVVERALGVGSGSSPRSRRASRNSWAATTNQSGASTLFSSEGAAVRKAVRKEPGVHVLRPLDEDPAASSRRPSADAKTANGDERVAPPVREPGIARHDAVTLATLDDVSVRAELQERANLKTARALALGELAEMSRGRARALGNPTERDERAFRPRSRST
jgi:hypothetical protein